MNKTLFLDIDGCLVRHNGNLSTQMHFVPTATLPGVIEKLNEWNTKGYYIILTTGRKECMRDITNKQLLSLGIFYDQLVMGLPRGERVVINDRKPGGVDDMALAINLERNVGLECVEV